jgi:TPR repeat protein
MTSKVVKMHRFLFMLLSAISFQATLAAAQSSPPSAPDALTQAAEAYDKGDYAQAISLARADAQSGQAEAQYLMGSALANSARTKTGLTTARADEAALWLRKAADQGHVAAMRDLGHLDLFYAENRNLQRAYESYGKAAGKGDGEAIIVIGFIVEDKASKYAFFRAVAGTSDPERRAFASALANRVKAGLSAAELASSQQKFDAVQRELSRNTNAQAAGARQPRPMLAEVKAHNHMASIAQLRFGQYAGIILNIDPTFGALQYTGGGLIGKN